MAINNIPNLFQPRVPGTASMPITYDSTPNLFNIDQAQVQQAINQKKIDEEQQQRKRLDQQRKLQNLADTFRMINANKSGNVGAGNVIADRIAQRKLLAEQKQKREEFKKNNPGMVDMLNALEVGVPASVFKGTNPTASIQEFQYAQQNGYEGSFQEFLNSKKATTNINTGISGFQKSAVDNYNDVQAAAKDARVINTSLDTLDNLLQQGVDTGFGAGFGLGLQRVGQTLFGEDYKVEEIAGREVFVAETTKLILPLVKQLGVNPTDKDLDFVKTGAIELSKSEAGNKIMITALRLSQNRKMDEANFDDQFYLDNPSASIQQRNIEFKKHMNDNPELYTSTSLQQAYDELLLNQSGGKVISTNEDSPFQ
jgi:hypothetical protein